MDDLLCINDKFSPEVLAFYEIHGIVTPIQDVVYSIRILSRNSEGNWEVLLNQIINKEIPIKHPILGTAYKEPAWKVSRFAHLNGNSITEEELAEFAKNKKKETVLVPLKTKQNDLEL